MAERRARSSPRALAGEPAWIVGGAVRDRLLGRAGRRPRPRRRRRRRGPPRSASRKAVGRPDVLAVAGVRRLAGPVAATGAWQRRPQRRSTAASWTRTCGCATSRSTRSPSRSRAATSSTPPAAAPTSTRGCCGWPAAARSRTTRCGSLRVARFACELGFAIDPATAAAARAAARRARPRRRRAGLRRAQADPRSRPTQRRPARAAGRRRRARRRAARAVRAATASSRTATTTATSSATRSRCSTRRSPSSATRAPALGAEHADAVRAVLAEPLADGLTRGRRACAGRAAARRRQAADAGRARRRRGRRLPRPRRRRARSSPATCSRRLKASERCARTSRRSPATTCGSASSCTSRPLAAHGLYRYLTTTEPVEVDVTLLSVADRLATRGRKADEAIAKHVELAREMLGAALAWRAAAGAPRRCCAATSWRASSASTPGPRARARCCAQLAEARYAGEISDARGGASSCARRAARARVLSRATTRERRRATASAHGAVVDVVGVSVGQW